MSKKDCTFPTDYATLLQDIKNRIRQAQTRAILSANATAKVPPPVSQLATAEKVPQAAAQFADSLLAIGGGPV